MKAKNVCLPLVDLHQDLSRGGLIQLFTVPHPPKLAPSLYLSKTPPNMAASLEKSQTNVQGLNLGIQRIPNFYQDVNRY